MGPTWLVREVLRVAHFASTQYHNLALDGIQRPLVRVIRDTADQVSLYRGQNKSKTQR
jgi:hypothetical protein